MGSKCGDRYSVLEKTYRSNFMSSLLPYITLALMDCQMSVDLSIIADVMFYSA